jgi:hypothetical protein
MSRTPIWIFGAQRVYAVVLGYGSAVISVAVALAAALLLRDYDLPHPFTSFSFAAIAISFWYAGPGLLALSLSYFARDYFSSPVTIGRSSSEPYLVIYGIFGLFMAWFSSSRRRAERLLAKAHDDLEIRVTQRTAELTTVNEELQSTQAELQSQKTRLLLLLKLTTDAVSNLEISDLLKAVTASVREIMRSDFAGIGLPDPSGNQLRVHALAYASDGSCTEGELVAAQETVRLSMSSAPVNCGSAG